MKFLFRKSDGKVLGAQALGQDGPAVDKRISALAVAIQMGATIYDLGGVRALLRAAIRQREGSAELRGNGRCGCPSWRLPLAHWDSIDNAFLLDVREPMELVVESVPGAVNIPMGNCVHGWANFLATARFMSSAVLPSAPTMRPAFFCKTDSKHEYLRRHVSRAMLTVDMKSLAEVQKP